MLKPCFTGNPFVDASLAGMCAAANIDSLDNLDAAAVERAVDRLVSLMTSDSTFKKRLIEKRETAFNTSEMSVIFPNGPLSQNSYKTIERKREAYKSRVFEKRDAYKNALGSQHLVTEDTCFVDGSSVTAYVGNDEFPLVDSKSKRNFHPGLAAGHPVGAVTALALEFFPLSVLRTGINSGFFWFVHTAAERIAVACARLTLLAMNSAIARGDGLGFYGDWGIPSRDRDAAFVALIRDLMSGVGAERALSWVEFEKASLPVTAYLFSNDNRGANIEAHDLPHDLFWFFACLRIRSNSSGRFVGEVMASEYFGRSGTGRGVSIARSMLNKSPIVSRCVVHPSPDKLAQLRGGWRAHALYATEVFGLSGSFIKYIERVSERIVDDGNVSDYVLALRREAPLAFLRLRKRHLLSFEEYVGLIPPDVQYGAATARDYLLAAVYEREACAKNGIPFEPWDGSDPPLGEKHPLIVLIECVGSKLGNDPDFGASLANSLAKAKSPSGIRGALLRSCRKGFMSWQQFVEFFPPQNQMLCYQLRDYLLAYLYSTIADRDLEDPEIIEFEKSTELDDRSLTEGECN